MSFKGIVLGLKASIIASSCCTLPLFFVVLFSFTGAGSITAALAIPKYKYFFMAVGSLFLGISIYFSIKKKCGGSCSIRDVQRNHKMILISIVTYILLTMVIIYLVLPYIAVILIT